MSYTNTYNRNNPGLVIFLLDQTCITSDFTIDGCLAARKFIDFIDDSLVELLYRNRCGIEITIVRYFLGIKAKRLCAASQRVL